MEIINIRENKKYLREYIQLCSLEWADKVKSTEEMNLFIEKRLSELLNGDKVISVLGLVDNDILIGFISLFKYDGDECRNLTPWYATNYVKKEYRGLGYSKILNAAILEEAKKLGYDKVYLKSELNNYYEKFGAQYIKNLKDKEKLFYIKL